MPNRAALRRIFRLLPPDRQSTRAPFRTPPASGQRNGHSSARAPISPAGTPYPYGPALQARLSPEPKILSRPTPLFPESGANLPLTNPREPSRGKRASSRSETQFQSELEAYRWLEQSRRQPAGAWYLLLPASPGLAYSWRDPMR